MRVIGLLSVLLYAWPALAGEHRPSVVSLNLCADQLVLALADASQIRGVSYNAFDPAISHLSERAKRYPSLQGDAEEILALEPELVILSEHQSPMLVRVLQQHNIRVLQLDTPQSLEAIERQMTEVAAALGQRPRADILLDQMADKIAHARDHVPADTSLMLYRPGGVMDGGKSALQALLTALGVSSEGREGMRYVSLEEVVTAQPDLLLVEDYRYQQPARVETLLEHPALASSPIRIAKLPADMLICPNHFFGDVALQIAAEFSKPVGEP